MFRNNGDGSFVDVAVGLGVDATEDGRSAVYFDADGDGDLDLFVSNMNQPGRLFRNNRGNERNWLMVRPVGGPLNRDAVGAIVRVTVGDRVMVRPVLAGQGYQTSYCGPVHVGLGDATRVDRVEVVFPGGKKAFIEDVTANQLVEVTQ